MPPQPRQNYAQQLQDVKNENAKLKAQLENLSTVDDNLREVIAERDHLRSLLEQAKQTNAASSGQARISDLQTQVDQLQTQLRRVQDSHRQAVDLGHAYESKLASLSGMEEQVSRLQSDLRNVTNDRDELASRIRRVMQNSAEQVSAANEQVTKYNNRLRDLTQKAQQYEAIIVEVRSLIRTQPDVLAAIKQKIGFSS